MITIIGVGALGSHVALALRNLKQGLRVIDFDNVEQKNVLAQFHTKMSLRRNKAHALSQTFQGLFGVKVDVVPHKLTNDNKNEVLKGSELLIDCTDNITAREIIKCWAKDNQIPCLHGALSADGTFARIIWDEVFVADAEGNEGEATCIDGEHLPFFMLAASTMAIEAERFLKSGKKHSIQLTPSGTIRLI